MTRPHPVRRLYLILPLVSLVAMVGPLFSLAAQEDNSSTADPSEVAEELVGQLGSGSFVKRKQAMNDLVKIGLPALKALEAGALSPNREISYRCERVLLVVRDIDLQRRLVAFLRGADPAKYKLPAWRPYEAVLGVDADSKLVFVEMQKADPELMQSLEGSGKESAALLMRRLVVAARPKTTAGDPLTVGRTSAILFAAGDPRIPVTQLMATYVHRMISNSSVVRAMTGNVGTADVMRKLLSRWLLRQKDTDPYVNLLVAMQFNLKESLGFALKVLEGGKRSGVAVRVALLSVNRFGDSKHVHLVTPFLTDKTVVKLASSSDGRRIRVQQRDIALATAITLRKQDHRKFGFPHIRFDSYGNFHLESLDFASEEDRLAALNKWKMFEEDSKQKKSS